MDKQLRLAAAGVVVESDLSSAAKAQLLNFIKEQATDAQIKALLLDGKIVALDEQAEEIVNERFELFKENFVLLEIDPVTAFGIAAGGFAVATFITAVTAQLAKSWKKRMTAGGSACRKFKGSEFNKCMAKYRLDGEKEKMKILQSAMKQCNKSKVPARCTVKIGKMIANQKRKIDKTTERGSRSRRSFGHGKMWG